MVTNSTEYSQNKVCTQCGAIIADHSRFCSHCGAPQYKSAEVVFQEKWLLIKQAAFFYSLDLVVCGLALFDIFKGLSWLVVFDGTMALAAISFFVYNWKDNKELLKWKSFSWRKLAAYCAIAIAGSLVVHYSVNWLNLIVYSKDVSYYNFFEQYRYSSVLLILFTAVFPALFEELGYRGYLLQTLIKASDEQQAVYISSFLFAIIHLSFISLFWLIPFALFLGFTRVRENTIWYGIFFHFCFNMTACLLELR